MHPDPGEQPRPCPATVVFTYPRSGSHYLMSLLASHPSVRALDEIINDHNPGSEFGDGCRCAGELLDRVLGLAVSEGCHPVAIVHASGLPGFSHPVFNDHPKAERYSDFVDTFYGATNFVLLRRDNWLERFSSYMQASKTREWHGQPGEYGYQKFRLDRRKLEKDFAYMEQVHTRMPMLCPGALTVTYEGLCSPVRAQLMAGVLAFMGLPPHPLEPSTLKQSRGLESEVENLGELRRHFACTRWSRFFPS